jgi:enoyl-CoA hydratase/carnithine racemase
LTIALADYQDKFPNIAFERRDGILEMRMHTDGGAWVFDERSHHDIGLACRAIASDRENHVVILTGTGDRFCGYFDAASFARLTKDHDGWDEIQSDGTRMLREFLNIEVPVIAAVNGPALTHTSLPLLADAVLAADTTIFQDATHFVADCPPGDGVHIVWTTLLGLNAGRYFLYTGQRLSAADAKQRGVVAEVVPAAQLRERAWALAERWAANSLLTLRSSRAALVLEWRRLFSLNLGHGLALEGLAIMNQSQAAGPELSVYEERTVTDLLALDVDYSDPA